MNKEYSWPEEGDRLFRRSEIDDAWIHPTHINFVMFAASYKKAANFLVESAIGDRFRADELVYPIIFLYRHHVELQMKDIINTWRSLQGKAGPNFMHHRLKDLWCECREIIQEVFPGDNHTDTDVVEHIIKELAEADPGSFSFRYPVNKDGEMILESENYIDLINLREVIEKVSHYLDGTGTGVYEHVRCT